MHSQLEQYLDEVAARLQALPPGRRAEELRETRTHLETSVASYREHALSEDAAVGETLRQFGASEALGAGLLWAWRREERRREARSFWGAFVCATVLSFLLPRCWWAVDGNAAFFFLRATRHAPVAQSYYLPVFDVIVFAVHALAGGISGAVFRRRGVAGTALAVAVWYGVPTVRVCTGADWVFQPAVWVADYAGFALLAVLAAWVGSRWRGRELAPAQSRREERV